MPIKKINITGKTVPELYAEVKKQMGWETDYQAQKGLGLKYNADTMRLAKCGHTMRWFEDRLTAAGFKIECHAVLHLPKIESKKKKK